MKPRFRFLVAILIGVTLPGTALTGQTLRDGTFFLPGIETEVRSDGAPEVLDEMKGILGQWDVEITTYPTDSTSVTRPGYAAITYMNRGHAYMERLHAADFERDGHELNTISFLVFTPGVDQWMLGVVSSVTENVTLYNGSLEGDNLVLHNALRRQGRGSLTHYRAMFTQPEAERFTFELHASTDAGSTWTPQLIKTYTRRTPSDDFLTGSDSYGEAAPGLPDEAHQFDFLIGTWNAQNELTQPNGQTIRWPANATGGRILNGHAIMEYNWFDLDPNLPDAATTIVRIYNRAMRRWECLFLPNRGNSPLYFGGRWEDDQMVLTLFETHAADSISRFVFHSIEPDVYHWYAETSTDRGQTFTKTWVIETTRKSE